MAAKLDYWDRCWQVEGALEFASARVPHAENIRAYYQVVGTTAVLRKAVMDARPIHLFSMNSALRQLLEQRTFSSTNVAYAQAWLDVFLGSCESLDVARTRCKRLFLRQHPDKVGHREFGSNLANTYASLMWDLLVTTRALLADTELSARLYAPPPWHIRIRRALSASVQWVIELARHLIAFLKRKLAASRV